MISYIKGTIEHVAENFIVIETNGIGYQVFVSASTLGKIPKKGEPFKIYTYMQVKEDGIALFGFLTMEEINMFNMLISVSGVGPKGALAVLSTINPSSLMLAIITDDVITLSKAPGIGKKTAMRLVLELKDKIKTNDAVISSAVNPQQSIHQSSSEKQDAIDALIVLGYSRSEAVKAVMEVALEGMKTDQIIKLGLKKLSNSKNN